MNKILPIRIMSTFVKFKNLPACINCVHFIEDQSNYPYDPPPKTEYGKCKLFGKQNMVTGEINNEYASVCRHDEKKCGEKGQYFVSNK